MILISDLGRLEVLGMVGFELADSPTLSNENLGILIDPYGHVKEIIEIDSEILLIDIGTILIYQKVTTSPPL